MEWKPRGTNYLQHGWTNQEGRAEMMVSWNSAILGVGAKEGENVGRYRMVLLLPVGGRATLWDRTNEQRTDSTIGF